MNETTLKAISAAIGLVNPALGIISTFIGEAAAAKFTKVTGQVQDAVKVVGAVAPLIAQFGAGKEVTPDQVRSALADAGAELDAFDAEIKRQDDGSQDTRI